MTADQWLCGGPASRGTPATSRFTPDPAAPALRAARAAERPNPDMVPKAACHASHTRWLPISPENHWLPIPAESWLPSTLEKSTDGRELLWWYVEEIRGEFRDDPENLHAPLFPSERLPRAFASLDVAVAPAVTPGTFRKALKAASRLHLQGRSRSCSRTCCATCATHNYKAGMPLWDVQVLLGHVWPTTTVGYLKPRRVIRSFGGWSPPGARCAG